MTRARHQDVSLPDFAVGVHGSLGVSAACLTLQEARGVDVNLVLCAAFLGTAHARVPAADEISRLTAAVADWHREVVIPLRTVRRRLKTGPAPAPNPASAALRARIQKDEIEAEMIELHTLGALVGAAPDHEYAGSAALGRDAIAAMIGDRLSAFELAAIGAIAEAADKYLAELA